MTVLDRKTDSGPTILELVFAPLADAGVSPVVVDVGARNGMYLLPASYAARATLVGFEPNPEEYEKLVHHESDAERWHAAQGISAVRFAAERYFDCALWDADEIRPLYITRGSGACTLMGATLPLMRDLYLRFPDGDARRTVSFHELQSEVVEETRVRCRRLDGLLDPAEIVDFLKVDVEGGEMRVFDGATQLFEKRRILFVRSEFQAFRYYAEHPLLGDQHQFLASNGFRLLDITLDHPRYRRGPVDLPDDYDRGPLFAGDGLFALDPDENNLDPLTLHRLALSLFCFGFNSFALSLIRDAKLLTEAQFGEIEQAIRSKPIKSWRRRMLDGWNKLPIKAYGLVEPALRQFGRR